MANVCPEGCPLATRLPPKYGGGNPPCNRRPSQECLDALTQLGASGSMFDGSELRHSVPLRRSRFAAAAAITGRIANLVRR